MRAAFPNTVVVFVLLLVTQLAQRALGRDTVPVCTPEEEAAYRPFQSNLTTPGCDELSFGTCSDGCLAARQLDAQHAPNCSRTSASRHITTYSETSAALLKACENARANMTNKYLPQPMLAAPVCETSVTKSFQLDAAYSSCERDRNKNCTQECLKTIEDKISSAPFCRYTTSSEYTLGEAQKYVLVDCLNARKDDLRQNKVLNTVATVAVTNAAGGVVRTTTAVAVSVVVMLASLS